MATSNARAISGTWSSGYSGNCLSPAYRRTGTSHAPSRHDWRTGSSHSQSRQKLGEDFAKPLRIEDVAREIGMSVSGFHAHFKAATAMSPRQFKKRFRLQEARRLMLTEIFDAAEAGLSDGYL